MSWLSAAEELDEQTVQELTDAVGVIISGRDGYDAARAQAGEKDVQIISAGSPGRPSRTT